MKTCSVSYRGVDGILHTAEVQARSLYEAAVLAIKAFQDHRCPPGQGSHLEIRVHETADGGVTHSLTVNKVHAWLTAAAKGPAERTAKDRLREMIGG